MIQKSVIKAKLEDVGRIVAVDREVLGNDGRKEHLDKAVEEDRCLVALNEDEIVGFLIFDTTFFENSFISLIIVSPKARRKGFASLLIDYFINISPTVKVFSSTNQSNKEMQKVFNSNGFARSGIVENLDDGDPEIIYLKTRGTMNI